MLIIFKHYKEAVTYRTMLIFVFLLGYELVHALMFKLDYSLTFFKLFLVLLLSTAAVDILKDRFIMVLTKTMVLISLISFVFVFLCYVPGLNRFIYKLAETLFHVNPNWAGVSTPTLLLFTFSPEFFTGEFSYVRNAGIFWESGAFAVFLNITLFLHYCSTPIKSVNDLFGKEASILILALITTTSTMGVVSLMIILMFFSSQLKTILKYVLLVMIMMIGFLAFTSVDFLGEKLNRELKASRVSNNRFGSALMDFENIAERPLLGWSRRIEVVFGTSVSSAKTHRPNGLTSFIRRYGFLYFSFYFILVFQSFKNIYYYHHGNHNIKVAAFGILLVLIVSFSELIFDLVFLKAVVFLYTPYLTSKPSLNPASVEKPIFT